MLGFHRRHGRRVSDVFEEHQQNGFNTQVENFKVKFFYGDNLNF